MSTCLGIARLDDSKVRRLRELEEEIGTRMLAVNQDCHCANLTDEQLEALQEAERELGVVLLAYEE